MALVQKSFSDIITFSRSSNATRVGPTGVLEYAPHNLILQSQTFDNASWTKSGSSVTANANSAPDGTVTGDKLIEDSSAGYHQTYQTASVTSGIVYTFSVYAKAAERTKLSVFVQVTGATAVTFDLSAGSYVIDSGSVTATITNVGNGWYRCSVTATATATGTGYFNVLLNNGSTSSYTGDGTSGIYLWGAQLSVGPYALDYTPTTSAAVYGPRFDYDGSGVTIVEPVSRNLLTYSEQFDNAAWTKYGSSVTANATASPDGTVNADKLVENSVNDFHYISFSGGSMSSAGTYTLSVFAKAAERSFINLYIFDGATPTLAYFNLANGTIGTVAAGLTAAITAFGNGWYRCSITRTITGSASANGGFSLALADNSNVYQGNGINGAFFWGAQLEVGSTATGYMVSGATNGFRAVPVVSGSATARGLLVEEQRTNLVTWSEDFSNGSWIKGLATISANSGTAPDGTQTADKLIPTAVSSADHGVYQITAASGVGVYTVSAFVKAAGYNFADIFDGYGSALITVDLTNGSYSVVGSPTATSVTAFGNGWYRVTITRTVSGVPAYIQIRAQNDINRTAFTGDGTSGIYVWGAQSEQASFATSYIPTIGTVTRSADVASVDTLLPWMNQTEGTIFAEYSFYGADAAYNNTAVMLTDGTENNYEAIFGYNPAFGWVTSGGATSAGLSSGGSTAINTNYKAALAFKVNDFAFSLNGGAAVTDTSGTVPTITQMLLGRRVSNSKPLHGHLRRVAFYPRRLTNAEIQALTA